jgi:GT2 family glycosyltransferase
LAGLAAQRVPPDEVVVVRRASDHATAAALSSKPEVVEAVVGEPGVVAAMRRGVTASRGQIIAFVDDDSVPRSDWIEGLAHAFDDPTVGGVGGRDVVHSLADPEPKTYLPVGLITAWGKLIGNHHLGSGPARDAMVLKGVNMAFRREALALPLGLRGVGAEVHFEVATSLWALGLGWRLVYDPGLAVDHYPGPRFDPDQREHADARATADAAHNLVYCLLSLRPDLFWKRAAFGLMVGDRMTPGLARTIVGVFRREPALVGRLRASLAGQLAALSRVRREGPLVMVSAPPC